MCTVIRLFAFVCRPGRGVFWLLAALLGLGGSAARAQGPDWQMLSVFDPVPSTAAPLTNPSYHPTATVADSSGHLYQTGSFTGKVNFGADTLVSAGGDDVYVAKWDIHTRRFLWAVRGGGTGSDQASALALAGNDLIITGGYRAATAQFGTVVLPVPTGITAFVSKLTVGGSFVWTQALTAASAVPVASLVAQGNNLYVAGSGPGATSGSSTACVTKFVDTGTGVQLQWTWQASGSAYLLQRELAVVGSNVYLSGYFSGRTATFGTATLTNAGNAADYDIYVAKLTDLGPSAGFVWAQRAGGVGSDYLGAMTVSGTAVYLTGQFGSGLSSTGAYPATFGTQTVVSAGNSDVYVAKLVDAGSSASFSWVQRAGGSLQDAPDAIVVRGTDIYVGGAFLGTGADFGNTVLSSAGYYDAFLTKLTDAGSAASFDWAVSGGGADWDDVLTLTLANDTLYVAGRTTYRAIFGSQVLAGPQYQTGTFLAVLGTAVPPALRSFAPASGPVGTYVTLRGSATDFHTTSTVFFNGTPAPGFVVNSATQITVAVPAGASSGRLSVRGPGGTTTSAGSFTVLRPAATGAAMVPVLGLFPNPAHSSVTLALPAAPAARSVQVLDGLGREVRRGEWPARTTEMRLIVAGLAPGVFAVRVGAAVARLVVE